MVKNNASGLRHGVGQTDDCQSEGFKVWQQCHVRRQPIPLNNGEGGKMSTCNSLQMCGFV